MQIRSSGKPFRIKAGSGQNFRRKTEDLKRQAAQPAVFSVCGDFSHRAAARRRTEEGCFYLDEVHMMLLLCLAGAAVLADLKTGRIPNGIIAAGLGCGMFYQIFENGPAGAVLYLGGAALPVLVFAGLYYFRMIGAGDIKLLCMAGGFFGPSGCFSCIVRAVFLGGAISLALMLLRRNAGQRAAFFAEYVEEYSRERRWRPYAENAGEDAKFCFSVPVLFGIICVLCDRR